jgi:hypothetical protein
VKRAKEGEGDGTRFGHSAMAMMRMDHKIECACVRIRNRAESAASVRVMAIESVQNGQFATLLRRLERELREER